MSIYRLVILNEFDRPEARMIALVRESDEGVEWTYLSADKRLARSKWLEWNPVRHAKDMTDVETFGVKPVIEIRDGKHMLRVERVASTRASYADGHPRDWQGYIGEFTVVRPALVPALKSWTSQPVRAAAQPHGEAP